MDTITEEYSSSLEDLTFNSKPHINMLTILAEENKKYADHIVNLIEARLSKAGAKLPILYLLDSIVKNVGENYRPLFAKNLVHTFQLAFKASDDKQKMSLYKLRSTWDDHFPLKALYLLDVDIKGLDPNWPVKPLPAHLQDNMSTNIHINPKFLKKNEESSDTAKKTKSNVVKSKSRKVSSDVESIQQQLVRQQKELLDLQQKKLILELEQTKQQLQEKEKEIKLIKKDKKSSFKTSEMESPMQENFKITVPNVSTPVSLSNSSQEVIISKDPRLKSDKRISVEKMSPIKNKSPQPSKTKNSVSSKKNVSKNLEKERNVPSIKTNPTDTIQEKLSSKLEPSKIKINNTEKRFLKKSPTYSEKNESERKKKRSYRNKISKSPTPPPSKILRCSSPPIHQRSISPDSKVKRLDPRTRPIEKKFPGAMQESGSTSQDMDDCSVSPRFSPEPDIITVNKNQKYREQKKKGNSLVARRVSVDPNVEIPQELTLSHKNEILEQADLQLHNGQLTQEQHQEMLNQLHHIFELQRDRKLLLHGQNAGGSDHMGFNRTTSQSIKKNSHSYKKFNKHSVQIKHKDQFNKSESNNMLNRELSDQECSSTELRRRRKLKSYVDKKSIRPNVGNSMENPNGNHSIRRFAHDDVVKKHGNKIFKSKSSTFSKRIPKLQKTSHEKDKLSDIKRGPEEPEDFIIANIPTKDESSKEHVVNDTVNNITKQNNDDESVRQTCEEPEEFIIAGIEEKEDSSEADFAYREHIKKIQRSINSRKPNSEVKDEDGDLKKKITDNLKSPPLPLKKRRYVSFETKQSFEDKKGGSQMDEIQNKENFEDRDSSSSVAVIDNNGDLILNDDVYSQGSRSEESKPNKHQHHHNDIQRNDWPRDTREHFRGRGMRRGRGRGLSSFKKGHMRFGPRSNKDETRMRYGRMQENFDDLPNMEREKRRPPLLRHHGPGWNSPPRGNSHGDIARDRLRPHMPTSIRRDNCFPPIDRDFYMDERRSPPRPHFYDEHFLQEWDALHHRKSPIDDLHPSIIHDDFQFLNHLHHMPNQMDLPQHDSYEKLKDAIPKYHHDMFSYQSTKLEPSVEPEINQIDVNKLLSDLLNKGIIPGNQKLESNFEQENKQPANPPIEKTENTKLIETGRPISPFNPDSITVNHDADIPVLTLESNLGERHNGIVNRLYTGIQCATCGLRFTTMQTDLYADHLDWHFRSNKKDKDGYAHNHRTIYPTAGEWICFEEIDNIETRTKSTVFDALEDQDDDNSTEESNNNKVGLTGKSGEEYCRVCKEGFNTIYNESEEVWQFENCIKIDDLNFHPNCYEDHFQNSLIPTPIKTPLVPINSEDDVVQEDKAENVNLYSAIPGLDSLLEPSNGEEKECHDVKIEMKNEGEEKECDDVKIEMKNEERECPDVKIEIIPKSPVEEMNVDISGNEESENLESIEEIVSSGDKQYEESVNPIKEEKIDVASPPNCDQEDVTST